MVPPALVVKPARARVEPIAPRMSVSPPLLRTKLKAPSISPPKVKLPEPVVIMVEFPVKTTLSLNVMFPLTVVR